MINVDKMMALQVSMMALQQVLYQIDFFSINR